MTIAILVSETQKEITVPQKLNMWSEKKNEL